MVAIDDYSEIVWIKDSNRLVDAESYERIYRTPQGPHPSGYYIARWPVGTSNPHFLHDGLTLIGPYQSRRMAAAMAERASRA